jgi:hypothetical protein
MAVRLLVAGRSSGLKATPVHSFPYVLQVALVQIVTTCTRVAAMDGILLLEFLSVATLTL